ncbi:SLAC1 anion channel family protein [Sulfurospirillum barnesii]|uniref:Tellurite resistance protein-like permease n=1 Tax=Sulfurospirillum barnesii (strain ATCC 700032 / DSM 10660 / SES-3) TaxID=760154 RepID=I3XZP2_SULBS|nr:SLAC1 anion channel family protein [Sulfurospirillum barnesii]AFL69416.1 tellurite resistance protein-like permease [Sulfurospirillum barnesii SES-3]
MEVTEKVETVEQNRLKFFPVMMYAIVMGLCGLTIMYQKAVSVLGFSEWIAFGLMGVSTFVFALISVVYMIKFFTYQEAVKKEFMHPVRINFFAAISISMLMLAIIYKEHYEGVAAVFWYAGVVLHFYLTMYTISFWINHNQELAHSNPAWLIPVVGNVLVPIGGVGFASQGVLLYFFSIGIFFWLVLFAILLNRIIFHHQLAIKFMPTLFILIAPPAVGFLAYFKMFGVVDLFANILFDLALFFTLLIAFLYKNFLKIKFFISWWAFVFPLAAMGISSMIMYSQTHDIFTLIFSYVMVAVTTAMIGVVIYQTVLHMQKGEICIQE